MGLAPKSVLAPLFTFAAGLRFPYLFLLILVLFIIDVATPDLVPFVDEIILGLLAVFFGNLRKKISKTPVDKER